MMTRALLPVSFRAHLVKNLMRLIKAGESVAIIGMASVGKSNVVYCLQQSDIQKVHLGKQKKEYLVVRIDSNDLTSIGEWHLFELLLYCLSIHCQHTNLSTEITSRLEDLNQKLRAQEDSVTHAQRCFEQAIHWLCQIHRLKVVLLFDEFDLLFQKLSSRFFVNLRALRDKNKYSLGYILFLRNDLEDLQTGLTEVEAFVELFQNSTFYLKPYDLSGTELMLSRLSDRQQITWPVEYTPRVFNLSGGHGGLISVIFSEILSQIERGERIKFDLLIENQEIINECQKIWSSLTESERSFLQRFVEAGCSGEFLKASGHMVDKMYQKGILRFESQGPQLFSALFAEFVWHKVSKNNAKAGFKFDVSSQTCWVNGRYIHLPTLPTKLLELLYENRGKPCRRIDILQHLYPDEDHSQFNRASDDPRLYDVVKNLRKRIEPDPQKPQYIKTVRGVGFKLDID